MYSGHCLCKKVSFKVTGELSAIKQCHCSQCRRSTGTSAIATTIAAASNFVWLSGEQYIKTFMLNTNWGRCFCSECGSPVPGVDQHKAYIPAGLLNEPTDLMVSHHICVESKASWDKIGDDGRLYPNDPGF